MCYNSCFYCHRYTGDCTYRRTHSGDVLPCEVEYDEEDVSSMNDLTGEVYVFETEDRRAALAKALETIDKLRGDACAIR